MCLYVPARARGRMLIVGVRHFGGFAFLLQIVLYELRGTVGAVHLLVLLFKLEFRSVFIWDERKHHDVASIGFLCGLRWSTPPPLFRMHMICIARDRGLFDILHLLACFHICVLLPFIVIFLCRFYFTFFVSLATALTPNCKTHSFAYPLL